MPFRTETTPEVVLCSRLSAANQMSVVGLKGGALLDASASPPKLLGRLAPTGSGDEGQATPMTVEPGDRPLNGFTAALSRDGRSLYWSSLRADADLWLMTLK